jgi:NOL1/NOP2/sun family putative RNA methylase
MNRNKQDVLPQDFIYRLKKIVPPNEYNSILHAYTLKRPTTLRANTLKIEARALRNIFFEKGIKLENVHWYKDAFIVKNKTLRELMDIEISAYDRNFLDPQLATGAQNSNPGKNSENTQLTDHILPSSKCDLRKFQSYREYPVSKKDTIGFRKNLNLYKEGYFYVQSLSSMIPPLVLDPKSTDKVLDICAAPGSKTTQMAAMMENKGEVLANDSSPIRRMKLEANLKIQGVKNTYLSGFPAQSLWEKFPEFFDKTLVDVPCSMEGRFCTFEPKSYEGWSEKKVKNLAKLQKWMLRSAVSATKPGGRIVYSTCTLSPEENEEVIDWILEKEKGNIEITQFSITNIQFSNGITEWEGGEYNPEVKKCARINPSGTMEGFFVASIRKIKSNVGNNAFENDL